MNNIVKLTRRDKVVDRMAQSKWNCKYSKNALNEQRDYGSGPGTKHFNRNHRPQSHSDDILNESVISCPKIKILKTFYKCVSEQKLLSVPICGKYLLFY